MKNGNREITKGIELPDQERTRALREKEFFKYLGILKKKKKKSVDVHFLFYVKVLYCKLNYLDRTLSGATTPDQSGPGSDGNKGVLRISQSSSITGALPSHSLESYRWGGS